MNIITRTFQGYTVFRPDTTWERYSRDFYVPDDLKNLYWVPVVYAKVDRPGKCIQKKFVKSYYCGDCHFGLLFYPDKEGVLSDSLLPQGAFAQACTYDHSSILTNPVPDEIRGCSPSHSTFGYYIDGEEVYRAETLPASETIENALVLSSEQTLLRNGDIIAVELCEKIKIDPTEKHSFHGLYSHSQIKLFDFDIIC